MKAKPMYFYRFWRTILGFFGRLIHRIKIVGANNVPSEGAVVIASSHVNAIDPMLLAYCLKRDIRFIAKKELFKNPIVGGVLTHLGAFPVDRDKADRAAVTRSLEVLREGGALLVFPEGTRSKTGELGAFKPGAAMFAIETGAPVVPATIISSGSLKPFKPTTVVFGEPIPSSELGEKPASKAVLHSATERIREAVVSLQNAEYIR